MCPPPVAVPKLQVETVQRRGKLHSCSTCFKHVSNAPESDLLLQVPANSIANTMGLASCPPVLAVLNFVEARMVSLIQCCVTVIQLATGQHAMKGMAVHIPCDAAECAIQLPR